jgi:hypothetical protein
MSGKKFLWGMLMFGIAAFGADKPGGVVQTAVNGTPNTYEFVMSPAYTMSPGGAYLSTELRYTATEDYGAGLSFGAGEIGFNLGGTGAWYVTPETDAQPAIAVLGGAYFNRIQTSNYLLLRLAPTLSKSFKMSFGRISPYGSLEFAPSLGLGNAAGDFALKTSGGIEFTVNDWKNLKFWTEVAVGILNSPHAIVLGISYPLFNLGS